MTKDGTLRGSMESTKFLPCVSVDFRVKKGE